MTAANLLRKAPPAIVRRCRDTIANWRWKAFLARNRIGGDFSLGAWSMQPDDFYVIARILARAGSPRPLVVELGSGASTVVVASILARQRKPFTIVSIEGDGTWLEETRRMITHHQVQSGVELYHAPYRSYDSYQWFDRQVVDNAIQGRIADLIIVDAPPGNLCALSRNPALKHLDHSISAQTHILLHDAYRPDEEKIMCQWSKSFATTVLHKTEKGLCEFADVIKTNSARTAQLPPNL